MFGRLIGIWISQKISPAMYASVDMIICTIVISLMAIPAIAGNNLTYAVTAIYGLAMSTVYGSGVSLTATYMNVSGTNFRWHLTSDDLIGPSLTQFDREFKIRTCGYFSSPLSSFRCSIQFFVPI